MEEDGVKEFILTGYKKLFFIELIYSTFSSEVSQFSSCFLTTGEKNRLSLQISKEEIRASLWALKAFKAPGPDGLHARFFQYFWHDVKELVCMEIKRIFASGSMLDYLNRTLISLIPKCQYLETLGSYRPINLCNSVYKIVTKIVVGRIRLLLNKLVSPVQAAFVPGKRGLDNIIIAQELIHSIDNKMGKEGYMEIKVDLEKAYDRIEWNFIHKVLQAYLFPNRLITLIMSCVSLTSISIMFNGSMMDSFQPSRGIRQGDPLFPFLFILCMEYLRSLIDKECIEGDWALTKASRGNLEISLLFFLWTI